MFYLNWLIDAKIEEHGRVSRVLNFDWLSGIPVESARWAFLGLFILIGLLVLLVPAHYVFEGVKTRHWWCDLRLWAIGVLALLFFTYAVL